MNLHLEFEYTYDEFAEAQRAHFKNLMRPNPKMRFLRPWVLFVFLSVVFFIVMQSKRRAPTPPPPDPEPSSQTANSLADLARAFVPALPRIAIILAVIVAFVVLWKYTLRRGWTGQRHLKDLQQIDLTDDGLRHASKLITSHATWSAFSRWIETPNLFVLYTSEWAIQMIPKRAFPTPPDVDEFRDFLRQTIGPQLPQHAGADRRERQRP